jgi:hypothetical protein
MRFGKGHMLNSQGHPERLILRAMSQTKYKYHKTARCDMAAVEAFERNVAREENLMKTMKAKKSELHPKEAEGPAAAESNRVEEAMPEARPHIEAFQTTNL